MDSNHQLKKKRISHQKDQNIKMKTKIKAIDNMIKIKNSLVTKMIRKMNLTRA